MRKRALKMQIKGMGRDSSGIASPNSGVCSDNHEKPEQILEPGITLAVGCGGNNEYPHSTLRDVNLDIRLPTEHFMNFVLADAMHLPFKEKVFRHVYGAHIAEHLIDPEAFIQECRRVGESLELSFPRWFSAAAYLDPTHRWMWFAGKFRPIPHSIRWVVHLLFANRVADFIFRHASTIQLTETHVRFDSE